jgi:glycosyltransferase involved in cell wall biosynthesis
VFFPKYLNNPLFWNYGRSMWTGLEARAIRSLIETEHLHFDLIHAHFTWPSGAVAVEIGKTSEVPVVVTEHTSATVNKFLDNRDPIAISTWRNADAVIRVNKLDIGRICEAADIPASSVHYIPNGYDADRFYPMDAGECRRQLDLPLDKKIILNVANPYDRVKGHDVLIDAFEKIAKVHPNVICVVVGDGKLKDSLMSRTRELHLEDRLLFVGKKPHQEIPLWLNACDVFVLPSLMEGNPTVMFECLGCGKPFVGTKVGGIPGVITSGDYGLLCEPGDAEDLAEKLAIALEIKWDRKKIIDYSGQFTWENISKSIMDLYHSVL